MVKPAKDAHVEDIDFQSNYKSDFYDYGMSVIEDRAIPDIRDGLKPVHRAIMTEMLTSHITSKNKPTKVAKITGAVIGRWHPHGDTSVEDALAGMAAPWKNSMPPIEIKGNGGSVYGDTHAAGRYIEARLTPTGDAYGQNLKQGIVPYVPNFDETAMMPSVMPAQLPYLLINGTEGIAVGVASNIPTHNPIEVINTFISFVSNQKQTVEELMQTLPGPDFPTKGEIINKSELAEIYKTGIGQIRVRGRMRYYKKTNSLHIYEIPFTASGSMDTLVIEIANASIETTDKKGRKKAPKILGITSVLDHSGKDGIDITIQLRRGVDPDAMVRELFAKTRLETTLKFDFSALNNRRLRRYGLRKYLSEYLAYQHEIIINEYTIRKQELELRMEIIKGLLIMQQFIDEVLSSAKNSNGKSEFKEVLQTGKILAGVPKKYHNKIKIFKFSESQSEYISNMPIHKINRVDYQAIIDEGKQIRNNISIADGLIMDVSKRKRLIVKRHKDELKKLNSEEFKRKTDIIDDVISVASKLDVPETDLYVGMNKYQYLRIEEKPFDTSIKTTNKSRLGFITDDGVCWNLHLENTSLTKNNGTLITQLISTEQSVVGWTTQISSNKKSMGLFIFEDGNIKLTDMRKYITKTKATKVASGKSDSSLAKYIDVPSDAVGVKINDDIIAISDISVNGPSGHGKHMINPVTHVEVEFITYSALLPGKTKRKRSVSKQDTKQDTKPIGVAYFDGDDKLNFDWTESEPKRMAMFSIPYDQLLKSTLLFVHDDGTAKLIRGDQFKVSTKRQQIQADKKGVKSIYIGFVPETIIGTYTDGTTKRIKTDLISMQGKAGGGVRALYSNKHQLISVEDGENSDKECVSLSTQPK